MRDLGSNQDPATGAPDPAAAPTGLTVAELTDLRARLTVPVLGESQAQRVDRLRALEQLRCTVEAAQCEATADLTLAHRADAAARGVPTDRRDRGLPQLVGLARRESPHRGGQDVALAMTLRVELPCTRAVFLAGRIDRWKATMIARETACLTAEHRAQIDQAVAGDPDRIESWSPGQLYGELTRLAATLDPAGVAERRRRAEQDRRVSLRPAPDTMTWLSVLLPVKSGVSVYAVLDAHARHLRGHGDPRSLDQLRADLLVAWILHHATSGGHADGGPVPASAAGVSTSSTTGGPDTRVGVMVNLVVPDSILFGDPGPDGTGDETGWVQGHGTVPGDLLRAWIADQLQHQAAGDDVGVWLRRLYATPTGALVAMDSTARLFTGHLAEFIRLRDRTCRTPWCDAPIAHLDHAVPRENGGPTTAWNAQGLCESCNHAKQAPGWTARPRPAPPDHTGPHAVETTTPTGHTHTSTAPDAWH